MRVKKLVNKNPSYRLMVRIPKVNGKKSYNSLGQLVIETEWVEAMEVNLGSKKKPNNIIEFKFMPIQYEKEAI